MQSEQAAAKAAVARVNKPGPVQIALKDQGVLNLPGGFSFVPQPEAGRLLRAFGNTASPALIGLIFPTTPDAKWWATLDFIAAEYVRDDDAKNWKADELLDNLKEGARNGNEDREKRGFPALEITGWIEPPAYDAVNRRLVWSALVREIGVESDSGSVNYNTYALGRDGYFSLDLITSTSAIASEKGAAATMLAAISYNKGKGYEDFNASTDHIAEYGLAALVGGVALKKLGLFALGAAFLLKFAKIIGIGFVALLVGVRRFFSRSKAAAGPE
jgi:uncharacterized membrane-anchored protein